MHVQVRSEKVGDRLSGKFVNDEYCIRLGRAINGSLPEIGVCY